MGEKVTEIAYGAFKRDMVGECPNEDGWSEWAYNHPEFGKPTRGYGKALCGATFAQNYESEPAWLGFSIATLEYGETWTPDSISEETPAVRAWARFRELAAEGGVTLPEGRIIIAHDQ